MPYRLATAPCSWGVEDPANPDNPPWNIVLEELSRAGYQGLELGPYGYLPADAELLTARLEALNLRIVAGTLFDNFSDPEDFALVQVKAREVCSLISRLPRADVLRGQRYAPPYLVLIDAVHPQRSMFAGHPETAPRLASGDWKRMMDRIELIGRISLDEFGIRSVLHPHAGGYLEFADETDAFLADVPDDYVGLCLDTGHLDYSGMNPVEWLEKCAPRLDYIHFKDIDDTVYQSVIPRRIDFFEAAAEGVMCPIGKGRVDYMSVKKVLDRIGYNGWITLEQERDPKRAGSTYNDISQSRQYLEALGF